MMLLKPGLALLVMLLGVGRASPLSDAMTGSDDAYFLYLKDLVHLAKERARSAKLDASAASDDERAFREGVLMGWYSIISTMQSQANAFGIPMQALGLDDIDPERDLT
jgi:hypothetical protein